MAEYTYPGQAVDPRTLGSASPDLIGAYGSAPAGNQNPNPTQLVTLQQLMETFPEAFTSVTLAGEFTPPGQKHLVKGTGAGDQAPVDERIDFHRFAFSSLQAIASHKMASICILTFYKEVLCGLDSLSLTSLIEGMLSQAGEDYASAVALLMNLSGGGLESLSPQPSLVELKNVSISDNSLESVATAIVKILNHRSVFMKMIKDLLDEASQDYGDAAIEGWCLNQLQKEMIESVSFSKLLR